MRAIIKTVKVFPAYAGVIPDGFAGPCYIASVPRVCGGDPAKLLIIDDLGACSPRMRG